MKSIKIAAVLSAIAARLVFGHSDGHVSQSVHLGKRQDETLGGSPPAFQNTTTSQEILALITPSPGASPVAVTSQSQTVTSFVAQFTLCALPPVYEVAVSPSVRSTGAPFGNYSTSYIQTYASGTGSCTTSYSPTVTTVCATVLDDLVTKYTVTSCSQDITFSSQYGYALMLPTQSSNTTTMANATRSTITAAPSIQTLTTYYMAPWQDLTSAGPPSEIDLKICTTGTNGNEICVIEYQSWITSLVTKTSTYVTSIDFTTELFEPSQLIFETITANITETMSIYSLFTSAEVSFTTEVETTTSVTRAGSVSTGPTVFTTRTVEQVSSTPTSTITLHITSTIYVNTVTSTVTTSSATPA